MTACIPFRAAAFVIALASLATTGCGSAPRTAGPPAEGRGAYKVGKPYTINGETYSPHEDPDYRETGVASWYGPGFHGRRTANGEVYDQNDWTAAHRTLPMPSVVRVTNLDNGASTVVRINDRGPFARSRIIDLSRNAARELDMMRSGTANVRVEIMLRESDVVKRVALDGGSPGEQVAALKSAGGGLGAGAPSMAAAAVASSPPRPAPALVQATRTPLPAPVSAPQPSVPAGGHYIQAGAFSTVDRAESVRATLATLGDSSIQQADVRGRGIYRVRLGPWTTVDEAQSVLGRVHRAGYPDAQIVRD